MRMIITLIGAVALMTSVANAEPLKLSDEQMDTVTAGFYIIPADRTIFGGICGTTCNQGQQELLHPSLASNGNPGPWKAHQKSDQIRHP